MPNTHNLPQNVKPAPSGRFYRGVLFAAFFDAIILFIIYLLSQLIIGFLP